MQIKTFSNPKQHSLYGVFTDHHRCSNVWIDSLPVSRVPSLTPRGLRHGDMQKGTSHQGSRKL